MVGKNESRVCEWKGCTVDLTPAQRRFCCRKHQCLDQAARRSKSVRLVEEEDSTGGTRLQKLDRIQQLLSDNGVNLDEVGSVRSVRLNEWTGLAKGGMIERVDPETGKVSKHRAPTRVVDMQSASIVLHPSWATGPRWELPKPPAPLRVQVPASKGPTLLKGWKSALIIPDPQIGVRRDIYDASLDPFHDERALDVVLQVADVERPDVTVVLGDWVDFAPFGKYQQEAAFALTVQPTIDMAYEWLAKFRAYTSELRFIAGNHDVRLQNAIIDNAKAAFGLKRGGAAPDEWPVLSIPALLRMDELGVEYIDGYPAGATYLTDSLACIHGTKVGNNMRSAASTVVEDERVSVIFGHTHHVELREKTRNSRGAPKRTVAYSPGCLARIDGAVPSVKSGVDSFGQSVRSFEDWQQGFGVVRYQVDGDRFKIEHTDIIEGWALYGGQEVTSRVDPRWANR